MKRKKAKENRRLARGVLPSRPMQVRLGPLKLGHIDTSEPGWKQEAGTVLAYGAWSEAVGERLAPNTLKNWISRFNWRGSVASLARLAHIAGQFDRWHDDPGLWLQTSARLLATTPGIAELWPNEHRIRAYLARPDRALVHERAITMLQGLAILHGADNGDYAPDDAFLALWFLAVNDYANDWQVTDSLDLLPQQRHVAELFAITKYDCHEHPGHLLARAALLFRRPHQAGTPLSETGAWSAVEFAAFPEGLSEAYVRAWVPLYIQFGVGTADDRQQSLYVDLKKWQHADPAVMQLLETLTVDRDAARAQLQPHVVDDRLHVGTFLHRRPFIRVTPDILLPLMPRFLASQLYYGIWNRFRLGFNAVKKDLAGSGPETWLSTFGFMFENYCQEIARQSVRPGTELLLPQPNKQELDDIIIVENCEAVVLSVKGSLINDDIARQQRSRAETFAWIRKLLFVEADKAAGRRAGVLRQLDASVKRVEAALAPTTIYPMVVTADALGYNAVLAAWLESELRASTDLVRPAVGVVTICNVDEYENFMALVAQGVSPVEMLRRRSSSEWSRTRLQVLTHTVAKERSLDVKHPFLMTEFGKIAAGVGERLQARKASPSDPTAGPET